MLAIVALMIPATALAASLHTAHVGVTCEDGGTFHFVATGGGGAGTLTANFTGGNVGPVAQTKYNNGTTHWWITGSGTLTGAMSSVGDKLVLSDYECDEKKD